MGVRVRWEEEGEHHHALLDRQGETLRTASIRAEAEGLSEDNLIEDDQ